MDYEAARESLAERIATGRDLDQRVIDAIAAVPRHEFVPERERDRAYTDRPVPIGHGQTASAPSVVALMTDLLDLSPDDRVLEIGTGCGYHAAVIATVLGDDGAVYSVEVVEELAADARDRLDRLSYDVHVRHGDGHEGWPEHAPYDAASLTCAPETIPDSVLDQTADGGRVVAPVGGRGAQRLVVATVTETGVDRERHGGVRFVPMVEE
ncbi:protein-L-isoaspartate(D-aspartate) O-methyltransferase [Haloparvum sedimenti]|uniref:protein-L-isoaspartate(D-aspartate) O-methyltransferase n=1 Tax=Haloparvum sedimenti TaxID=1678448 RepID=UPI00071E864A|nr:protein-L-isoaspartate(D-aspartate) O-methyltransferase [Haloparvum sedimenti]